MNRALILVGLLIVVVGLLWPWIAKLPLGQLPGDIVVRRDNFSFYFPVTTMILVSVVLSAVVWFFHR